MSAGGFPVRTLDVEGTAVVRESWHAGNQPNKISKMHPQFAPSPGVPLCIDMDGTLIKTNTMFESIAALARIRPAVLLLWPFWLLRGCAAVWRKIGPQTPLDAARLPYRPEVINLVRSEAATGRQIVLVTGAHPAVADRVAEHLGCFDAVIAETGDRQLVGERKARVPARSRHPTRRRSSSCLPSAMSRSQRSGRSLRG